MSIPGIEHAPHELQEWIESNGITIATRLMGDSITYTSIVEITSDYVVVRDWLYEFYSQQYVLNKTTTPITINTFWYRVKMGYVTIPDM